MSAETEGQAKGKSTGRHPRPSKYTPYSLAQFLNDFPGGCSAAYTLLREAAKTNQVARKFVNALEGESSHARRRASRADVICKQNNLSPIEVRRALTKAMSDYAADTAKVLQAAAITGIVQASIDSVTKGGVDASDERRAHLEKLEVLDPPKKGDINVINTANIGGGQDFGKWLMEADDKPQLMEGSTPLLTEAVDAEIVED